MTATETVATPAHVPHTPDSTTLPLDSIKRSPFNPLIRSDKNDPATIGLADSMASVGLLQPITVRPIAATNGTPGHWEVVAGERRVTAAKLLGWERISAIVRDMTDAEVMLAQSIENLQRKDLHPLDEADALQRLLHLGPDQSLAELSARVGRSPEYIRQRVQLTHLIDPAKLLLRNGVIGVLQAFVIARMPTPADQHMLTKYVDEHHKNKWRMPSAQDIAAHAEREIMLRLERAPFDRDDATLVEGRPACPTCPERTGANADLFAELGKDDRCLNASCFHRKEAAHVDRALVQLTAKLQKKDPNAAPPVKVSFVKWDKRERPAADVLVRYEVQEIGQGEKRCDHAQAAVWIDGSNAGKATTVCIAPDCKTHRPRGGGTTGNRLADEARERTKRTKRERAVRAELLKRVGPKIPTVKASALDDELLTLVLAYTIRHLHSDEAQNVARLYAVEPEKRTGRSTRGEDAAPGKDWKPPKADALLWGDGHWYGWVAQVGAIAHGLDREGRLRLLVQIALNRETWPGEYDIDRSKGAQLAWLAEKAGVDVQMTRAEIEGALFGAADARAKRQKDKERKAARDAKKAVNATPTPARPAATAATAKLDEVANRRGPAKTRHDAKTKATPKKKGGKQR
jgi:ParB family chromosome partitioning protein